jgi:hypothetical protein
VTAGEWDDRCRGDLPAAWFSAADCPGSNDRPVTAWAMPVPARTEQMTPAISHLRRPNLRPPESFRCAPPLRIVNDVGLRC